MTTSIEDFAEIDGYIERHRDGEMIQEAVLSNDGQYRYGLSRVWGGDLLLPKSMATFVMLNPSTADAFEDDPTIRRCIGFAKRWGMAGILVVNLMAYRATDPRELPNDPYVAMGPGNLDIVGWAVTNPGVGHVIAAWGAHPKARLALHDMRWPLIESPILKCLGTTKSGAPRHPLYVKGDTLPTRWMGPLS